MKVRLVSISPFFMKWGTATDSCDIIQLYNHNQISLTFCDSAARYDIQYRLADRHDVAIRAVLFNDRFGRGFRPTMMCSKVHHASVFPCTGQTLSKLFVRQANQKSCALEWIYCITQCNVLCVYSPDGSTVVAFLRAYSFSTLSCHSRDWLLGLRLGQLGHRRPIPVSAWRNLAVLDRPFVARPI